MFLNLSTRRLIWAVSARELFPKSALGENHRIGSKVKVDDLGPICIGMLSIRASNGL